MGSLQQPCRGWPRTLLGILFSFVSSFESVELTERICRKHQMLRLEQSQKQLTVDLKLSERNLTASNTPSAIRRWSCAIVRCFAASVPNALRQGSRVALRESPFAGAR